VAAHVVIESEARSRDVTSVVSRVLSAAGKKGLGRTTTKSRVMMRRLLAQSALLLCRVEIVGMRRR
jgi:hypothetical protein